MLMHLTLPGHFRLSSDFKQMFEYGIAHAHSSELTIICARITNYNALDLLGDGVATSIVDRLHLSLTQSFSSDVSSFFRHENHIYFAVSNINRTDLYDKLYEIYKGVSLLAIPIESASIAKCQFLFSMHSSNWENSNFEDIVAAFVHSVEETSSELYVLELPYERIMRCHSTKLLGSEYHLLKQAIAQDKLVFAYQPIVASSSGNIEYYECLARFPDKDGKLISAGLAIMEAESEGLINVIDHLVVKMAIHELETAADISLSVNVSNHGVCDPHLLHMISSLLTDKPDIAERLIIEITETTLNHDFGSTNLFISTVHDLGCRIALDDFGGGFTSIRQLGKLPIDIIKIDGSFIKDIAVNPEHKIFVEELIKIADRLGKKTVAEFVENGEIAKILLSTNIGGMQGNFFSPALSYRVWTNKDN